MSIFIPTVIKHNSNTKVLTRYIFSSTFNLKSISATNTSDTKTPNANPKYSVDQTAERTTCTVIAVSNSLPSSISNVIQATIGLKRNLLVTNIVNNDTITFNKTHPRTTEIDAWLSLTNNGAITNN